MDDDLNTQIAADEAARQEPEAVEEPVEVQADPEPEPENEYEKRISRLAYEKRTAEKNLRQAQERLAKLESEKPLTKDDENSELIERRAREIAAEEVYNARANAIYHAGVKEYPDFESRLAAFRDLGGITPQLVEAADEAGDAHKLIHYLSRNLDEAERVIKLPPHKMGAALGKIASKLEQPPRQSRAADPIKPITGKAKAELSDEEMPIDQYMRMENERWATRRRH